MSKNYPLFGALTTVLENEALNVSFALFLDAAIIPVRSVTGVALMMLSKASSSLPLEPDSASESSNGRASGRSIFSGCALSETDGFWKDFELRIFARMAAI